MEKRGKGWRSVDFSMGQTQIKVDDKGRMSLPTHAHGLLVDQSLILSLSVYEKRVFLELLSPPDWEQKLQSLDNLPKNHPKTKAIKRFMFSGAVKIAVDTQNRIIVPSHQREALGLQREAILINLDNKYELWSSKRWKETFGSLVESMEDLELWSHGKDLGHEKGRQEEASDELRSVA